MSTIELQKKVIEKVKSVSDENLLAEVYRLLELENEDIEIYKLNSLQKTKIAAAREQIKKGQFLSEKEANKEISEWL
ncbi:MAG: hypothetical protein M3015_01075 [Bacteroidota bacterium]|nr:hypothetical protein [Bacteroidota bacterium]